MEPASNNHDAAVSREPPSVLILTRNEEANLPGCLNSVAFSDDIVVLDSHSTDATVAIAGAGDDVRVVQRAFDNELNQRTYSLEEIEYKHPWLYICDADERVTPALREEMMNLINAQPEHVAYQVRYRNHFMGRILRFGGLYPVWLTRLVRPEKVRYEERATNMHLIAEGSVGQLQAHFEHFSFNKGLLPWFAKHNQYSSMESSEGVLQRDVPWRQHWRAVWRGDRGSRRRALKNLSFRLPCRGAARFLYMWLIKLGLLDGRAGFHYASLVSMYEYWIEVKMIERRSDWAQRTLDEAERLVRNRKR